MSRELTDQWRKGKLETGHYYFKTKNDVKNGFLYKGFKLPYDGKYNTIDDVEEVLAPIPSYEEFSQMVKKVEELEKQLDIAVKVLKDYADEENWSTATTEINTDYFKFEYSMYGLEHNGFIDAQKALKEMEEV